MSREYDDVLHRHLNLPLVTFYGIGTIIGAGIYVLVSEVARTSGTLMPTAFVVAAIIAGLTGLCYAELCCRYPKAAGAVLYVDKAFGIPALSQLTGVMVLLTGVVSAATISRGFVGYLGLYIDISPALAIVGLCLVMGVITSIGIRESAWAITLITLLEVGGLVFVLGFAGWDKSIIEQPANMHMQGFTPIMLGAFLAFYAFIGFEDMVNLAEEVIDPEHNVPRSIVLSIVLSTVLYLAVALAAVMFINLEQLAQSSSPLALMVADYPAAVAAVGLIGMVAISNGALTQIIMASRMLFGMARRGLLPQLFAHVNERTRTPLLNTWLVTAVILGFALWLPVSTLAKLTSAIMLLVFALVNLSLLLVKTRHQYEELKPGFRVPRIVPLLGLAANLSLLMYQLLTIDIG